MDNDGFRNGKMAHKVVRGYRGGTRGRAVLVRAMGPQRLDSQLSRGSVWLAARGIIVVRAWQGARFCSELETSSTRSDVLSRSHLCYAWVVPHHRGGSMYIICINSENHDYRVIRHYTRHTRAPKAGQRSDVGRETTGTANGISAGWCYSIFQQIKTD